MGMQSMNDEIKFKLSEVQNGELQKKFDQEFAKVMKNIKDGQTDPNKKRKVQINISFKVEKDDVDRENIDLDFEVKSTLAPQLIHSKVVLGEDRNGVTAYELKSGQKGQTYIDPKDGKMRTDAGELIDDEGNVIE